MTTRNRTMLLLDGLWDFCFEEGARLDALTRPADVYDDTMPVPGVYDVTPRYLRKRGLAFYGRDVVIPAGKARSWKVRVGGLGISGRIWLDGVLLGDVALAYNAYEFETGKLKEGTHRMVVAIDNTLTQETPFFKPNYDFYGFGGIYRSMSMEAMPESGTVLERVQVRTISWMERRVALRFVFDRVGSEMVGVTYRFDTEGTAHEAVLKPTVDGTGCLVATLESVVPEGQLWSPETPHLHTVQCVVKENGDAVCESFGIREFRAEKERLWLNGKPIRLMGFNRHESHPEMGPATTETLMLEDLHHLKEMHCNFIRGAHYPQDDRFLELCDRLGFLVWEEGLAWGNWDTTLGDPVFVAGQVEQMRRMVRKSVNHPSVVIWAFLNEFDSASDQGVALCKKLVDTLHEEDGSRPVSFACNRGHNDRCIPFVDVVAYNTYPGWICEAMQEQPESGLEADRDWLLSHYLKTRKPGAPVIVSEMGVCAVYGQREDAAAQWTEEFQAQFLERIVECVFGRSELQGLSIWQLTDALSFHRVGGALRAKPFAQNLAGVFDVYRRRKLGARAVARAFEKIQREDNVGK